MGAMLKAKFFGGFLYFFGWFFHFVILAGFWEITRRPLLLKYTVPGDVEGDAESHVRRALVQLTREFSVRHVELERGDGTLQDRNAKRNTFIAR